MVYIKTAPTQTTHDRINNHKLFNYSDKQSVVFTVDPFKVAWGVAGVASMGIRFDWMDSAIKKSHKGRKFNSSTRRSWIEDEGFGGGVVPPLITESLEVVGGEVVHNAEGEACSDVKCQSRSYESVSLVLTSARVFVALSYCDLYIILFLSLYLSLFKRE